MKFETLSQMKKFSPEVKILNNKIQNPFEVLDHESNVRFALSRYGSEQILVDDCCRFELI